MLGPGDVAVKKTVTVPALMELLFYSCYIQLIRKLIISEKEKGRW